MRTVAEAQRADHVVAGDIESVRIAECCWVAVGGCRVGKHDRSGRDADPRQLEVFGGDARQGEADRSVAHGFPHRVRNEFELIEQRPLVGIIAQKVHAGGRW